MPATRNYPKIRSSTPLVARRVNTIPERSRVEHQDALPIQYSNPLYDKGVCKSLAERFSEYHFLS